MDLWSIKEAFDHVAKRQKLSTSKSQEVIDQVHQEIEKTLARIQSVDDLMSPVDMKSILTELKLKLNSIGPLQQLEESQKELITSLSKYPKLVGKIFPDISKTSGNVDFDIHTVNHIIACHFYRQGMFDLGDCLLNEAGEPEVTGTRSHFSEMHQVLEGLRDRNLEPALNWITANHEILKQNGSTLELKLHTLQFVDIIRKGSRIDAIDYARTYLAPLAFLHMKDVQKLMVCLLYVGKLDSCPYADLIAPTNWEKFTKELTQQFCSLIGQSIRSPFAVTIAAGIEGLPTLLKLANVMAAKKHEWQEWQKMKQLPVPVELGSEFQFHSVFVCPVSRDQASEENPPMLMPCLHVLCKQSMMKLSKSSSRAFKCPYCPAEASAAQCRQLYF
ncbi:hypothetical protein SLE2022_145320 [Rubroshorea leprosula]